MKSICWNSWQVISSPGKNSLLLVPGITCSYLLQLVVLVLLLVAAPASIHAPEPLPPLPPDEIRRALAPVQGNDTVSTAPTRAPLSAAPPQPNQPLQGAKPGQGSSAKVAILIDDMGYNLEIGRQLLNLELQLTFSFLPQAPHTQELTALALKRGRTILVHLPMEPKDLSWKQEPLTLQVGDTGRQLRENTQRLLAAVPAATGANNHMGSRFTENRTGMQEVLSVLKEQRFFFIDSFTSAASVGEQTARSLGLATARRQVFLDNDHQEAAICQQLFLLTNLAIREGQAIAIGHPNQGMVDAFSHCARKHLARVQLVGVDRIVH